MGGAAGPQRPVFFFPGTRQKGHSHRSVHQRLRLLSGAIQHPALHPRAPDALCDSGEFRDYASYSPRGSKAGDRRSRTGSPGATTPKAIGCTFSACGGLLVRATESDSRNVRRSCPLAGHLLVVVVSGFALSGAVESQDGVDANFPDSLGDWSSGCRNVSVRHSLRSLGQFTITVIGSFASSALGTASKNFLPSPDASYSRNRPGISRV